MKRFYLLLLPLFFANSLMAQDLSNIVNESSKPLPREYTSATFKDFRIINAQTNETTKKYNLDFKIAHRFGDIGGNNGGAHTLYGFDGATDIRFSFDYGITDRLMVGVGRAKGIEPMFELYDANAKFRLLRQTVDKKVPLSISLFGSAGISARKPSTDSLSEGSYPEFVHRLSYVGQVIITRKFSRSLSLAIVPTYVHRNFVSYNDENDLYSIGIGGRMKITRRFAIVADYFYTISDFRDKQIDPNTGEKAFYNPLSVGLEVETGGHVFTINFTNSTGIIENELIPYTRSDWAKGQFRIGFNISRNFLLAKKIKTK